MSVRIEELMRGAHVEYKDERHQSPNYGKWIKSIVWGFTTDDNCRDVVELGVNGCEGFIDITSVDGIELTEDILLDYGFINQTGIDNSITYFRDDIGYVSLDAYGIKHMFMGGKSIKYLHNFERIFFEYVGKKLIPKKTAEPKVFFKTNLMKIVEPTAAEMLDRISEIKSRTIGGGAPQIKF